MAAAIRVGSDYSSADLRRYARRCGDADQVRRLLAVALILDGSSRSDAAKVAGVTLQIVRDWVVRFNDGGPEGLATRKAPGRASILNAEQRARLVEIVETGPIPAAHGVVRWRLADLAQWIFGAICPAEGKAAGIVMSRCNSEAMSLHLKEIAFHVALGAHAVILLDQAGWHGSAELVVPPNITLMPLPPRCPELNPVENVWQFMRDNWLSNRIFKSYDDIVDYCCHAWNKLVDQPWRIMSLGMRQWAHGF